MPLYNTISIDTQDKILLWKIEETFEDLFDQVALTDRNMIRLFSMKSELHQRAFLSVRKLLQEAGYSDSDLYYDESGKPHLNDETFISITHSHEFAAIILSSRKTGIDIELRREKIALLADKFSEGETVLHDDDMSRYISELTVIWGAKESIFKIRNEPGISFKDHIRVAPFVISDKQTTAMLDFGKEPEYYKIHFEEIENYTLICAFEIH